MAENKKGLNRSGYNRLFTIYLFALLQIVIFFVCAGRLDLPRAWLFFGIFIVCTIVNTALGAIVSPQTINIRGEKIEQDTKAWDRVFLKIYTAMIFVCPAVAGLDTGRFLLSETSTYLIGPGIAIYLFSIGLADWAMLTNTHFEISVRIQKDRAHKVITTGPYKIIRHPGYLGIILAYIAFPLILGSLFAWIPVGVVVVAVIVRTALEDKTLKNELEGYLEYSKKVKYRLIPGIW